jgi:chromosome segregation and condensation protein ScpB
MDIQKIIELVLVALGGGVGYKLLSSVFGYNASRIKSLTDIIDKMDARLKAQDIRIDGLEKELEFVKNEKLGVYEMLNRYKYAATFLKLCTHKKTCPMAKAFCELGESEKKETR